MENNPLLAELILCGQRSGSAAEQHLQRWKRFTLFVQSSYYMICHCEVSVWCQCRDDVSAQVASSPRFTKSCQRLQVMTSPILSGLQRKLWFDTMTLEFECWNVCATHFTKSYTWGQSSSVFECVWMALIGSRFAVWHLAGTVCVWMSMNGLKVACVKETKVINHLIQSVKKSFFQRVSWFSFPLPCCCVGSAWSDTHLVF